MEIARRADEWFAGEAHLEESVTDWVTRGMDWAEAGLKAITDPRWLMSHPGWASCWVSYWSLSDSRLKTPGVSPGLKASPAGGWAGAAGRVF